MGFIARRRTASSAVRAGIDCRRLCGRNSGHSLYAQLPLLRLVWHGGVSCARVSLSLRSITETDIVRANSLCAGRSRCAPKTLRSQPIFFGIETVLRAADRIGMG